MRAEEVFTGQPVTIKGSPTVYRVRSIQKDLGTVELDKKTGFGRVFLIADLSPIEPEDIIATGTKSVRVAE